MVANVNYCCAYQKLAFTKLVSLNMPQRLVIWLDERNNMGYFILATKKKNLQIANWLVANKFKCDENVKHAKII